MNDQMKKRAQSRYGGFAVIIMFLAFMLTACATAPMSPAGSSAVRNKLTELQNDPDLADRDRVALREAEAAVVLAEQPLPNEDAALGRHRVYMADYKVEIAKAKATTKYAEEQREQLIYNRDQIRLMARTREADAAHGKAEELQRQIDELKAKETERGLVLTLGDVLFASGSADIQAGANETLNKLVNFLKTYPDRRVLIEGHTDNVGGVAFNRELSQRRAESVKRYLMLRGIAASRLSVMGFGMDKPIATNETALGRQQNRRVEVVIQNAK